MRHKHTRIKILISILDSNRYWIFSPKGWRPVDAVTVAEILDARWRDDAIRAAAMLCDGTMIRPTPDSALRVAS